MFKLLGYPTKPTVGHNRTTSRFNTLDMVGVEFEFEGCSDRVKDTLSLSKWVQHADASLRNGGIELVFARPMAGEDIELALDELAGALATVGKSFTTSVRTSVHVHVDIRDMSPQQLGVMLLLYVIYERALYQYAGEQRFYNNNCLPVSEMEAFMNCVLLLIAPDQQHDKSFRSRLSANAENVGKYVGCNVSSIFTDSRGSVEFRMHVGTRDTEKIKLWVKMLLCLKIAAMSDKFTPNNLSTLFSEKGYQGFAREIFRDLSKEVLSQPTIRDRPMAGIRAAEYILRCPDLLQYGKEYLVVPVPVKPTKKAPEREYFTFPNTIISPEDIERAQRAMETHHIEAIRMITDSEEVSTAHVPPPPPTPRRRDRS